MLCVASRRRASCHARRGGQWGWDPSLSEAVEPSPFVLNSNSMDYRNGDLPITIDPETLGGVPVFRGTRVPVSTLFEYLEDNCSLEEFLNEFPSVTRDAAITILTSAERFTLEHAAA